MAVLLLLPWRRSGLECAPSARSELMSPRPPTGQMDPGSRLRHGPGAEDRRKRLRGGEATRVDVDLTVTLPKETPLTHLRPSLTVWLGGSMGDSVQLPFRLAEASQARSVHPVLSPHLPVMEAGDPGEPRVPVQLPPLRAVRQASPCCAAEEAAMLDGHRLRPSGRSLHSSGTRRVSTETW